MSMIKCLRCESDKLAMVKAPLLGAIGERIKKEICQDCFESWKGMEIKYINEYRLNMMDKEHRQFLLTQMKIFLGFEKDVAGADVPS